MLYKNESTEKNHVPGKKNFFQGGGFFSNFKGEIDQEVWGGGD